MLRWEDMQWRSPYIKVRMATLHSSHWLHCTAVTESQPARWETFEQVRNQEDWQLV